MAVQSVKVLCFSQTLVSQMRVLAIAEPECAFIEMAFRSPLGVSLARHEQ